MANIPLLLGHRGTRVHRGVRENTTAAFDVAIACGCDGFEFDVRCTASGRGVLCHDAVVDGVVVAKAAADQLQHLPVVEDVIRDYASRFFLDIELKVAGLEQKILGALRDFPPQRDYVVSSFLPDVIFELRSRNPRVPLGIIADTKAELANWRNLPVQYVIVQEKLCTEALIKEVHRAGRGIFVWTVNEPQRMRHFAAAEVDVVISDDPALLVHTLRPGKDGRG